jgi:hypothetical protein
MIEYFQKLSSFMENILPKYKRPIRNGTEPTYCLDSWDEALDAFDDKKYYKSIAHVINYTHDNSIDKALLKENKEFKTEYINGYVRILIDVSKDGFKIKVPFLKITENTNKVALLRKVSEINFRDLDIAQVHLVGDELVFEQNIPLILCEPYKIFYLISEMANISIKNSVLLVHDYDAMYIESPQKIYPTPDQENQVISDIRDILKVAGEYIAFFQEKQLDDFQWDIIVISLFKLGSMPYLNGAMKYEIADIIDAMYNGDESFNVRIKKGKKFINTLTDKNDDEFKKNIFALNFFMPKIRSSEDIMKERIEKARERVDGFIAKNDAMSLCYYLEDIFVSLVYDYSLDINYRNAIEKTLEEIGGLSPNDAMPKLLALHNAIYDKNLAYIKEMGKENSQQLFENITISTKKVFKFLSSRFASLVTILFVLFNIGKTI